MTVAWTDPDDRLLARGIFGTDDFARAAAAVEHWIVSRGLGPARVVHVELSVGAGITLARGDGPRLFVKVWPGHVDPRALAAQLAVQRDLAAGGFPAPALLAGPASLGPGWAAAMAFARPGAPADPGKPTVRRAMAGTLARLAAAAERLAGEYGLPRRAPLAPGAIWPRPHNALFDFAATAAGAGWIDALAAEALAVMRTGTSRWIAGHCDWSARNLRVEGGAIAMVYDWDSLFVERECVVVGSAVAQFLAVFDPAAPVPPRPAQAAAFVREHAAARGHPFTPAEHAEIAAAATYAWAYAARCEHALDPGGVGGAGSSREGLRAHGPFRLPG